VEEILFLILAGLTIFLSIKLSYYADLLWKTSKIKGALIGGIILAGLTSLPELVTCLSAIFIGNPHLAVGDILGSNIFNIFIICVFDIFFISKMIFHKTSNSHSLVYFLLVINYIFIYLFFKGIFDKTILNIGIPSIIIVFTYFLYIYKLSKKEEQLEKQLLYSEGRNITLKFIIVAVSMLFTSVFLTLTVNGIAINHPHFSSSLIGAILLGITTSLPEVITFYALINLNSYNMALSNIVGSNLFNLLVLSIGDIFFTSRPLYYYSDHESLIMISIAIFITFVNMMQNIRDKSLNKFTIFFPSLLIASIYLIFWYIHLAM
jgi:cation:H+ antiporter